jgi:hypothetical protein
MAPRRESVEDVGDEASEGINNVKRNYFGYI